MDDCVAGICSAHHRLGIENVATVHAVVTNHNGTLCS
jgi:hypothetical protein